MRSSIHKGLRRRTLVRQALNTTLAACNVHQWDTRDLAHAATQFTITRGDNVALVALYPLNDAIIRIGALVRALEALEPWVPSDPKGNAVFGTQLLQFRDHTTGNARNGCVSKNTYSWHRDSPSCLE